MSFPKPLKVIDSPKIRKRIKSCVKAYAAIFPNKRVVLDVGTRIGYSLDVFDKMGFISQGIEINKEYVKYARDLNRRVMWGDFMNTKLESQSFDGIFSRQTLEHMPDTLKFFTTCERILKPGGVIFLTFPFEPPELFYKKMTNTGLTTEGHAMLFLDKRSFRCLIGRSNFKEKSFGKSSDYGIIPAKNEMLFVGEL